MTTHPSIRFDLATGRYYSHTAERGIAIRTTVGHPARFNWRGEHEYIADLAPHGIFRNTAKYPTALDRMMAYHARLDERQEAIFRQLNTLSRANNGQTLVLYCFDDLNKSACHRTWAADWFRDRFNMDVPELDPKSPPPPQQLGLGF